MRKIGFALLTSVLLAFSCQQQAFYEENKSIPNRNWAYEHIPSFAVHIPDRDARYDVFVHLRHTSGYQYANLFLLVHEKGPRLKDTAFRHEMKLAELDGRWTGKGAGNLFENEILVKKNFAFPDTGIYHFGVEQNMRENPLKGVSDVGIKLIKRP